jgi:hypothetical protein
MGVNSFASQRAAIFNRRHRGKYGYFDTLHLGDQSVVSASPLSTTQAAICARDVKPSLLRMLPT